jgi:hypothetical protein
MARSSVSSRCENGLLVHVLYTNDHFTKTRSGQA